MLLSDMKKIILLILFCIHSFAIDKAIYDEDNRQNFHELTNPNEIIWAQATAAMIPSTIIFDDEGDTARIKGKMLSQLGICEYEKFAREIAAADCTGFLVSEDTIVTAGHCMTSQSDCTGWRWVFDYKTSDSYKIGRTLRVSTDKIYKCSHIVVSKATDDTDYAVIKLDRPVLDREFLKIRTQGSVINNEPLTLVGYPSGIPVKVAAGAKVLAQNHMPSLFLANTDSFAGNSGSPVINSNTGLVEGILVSGEEDYEQRKKGCMIPKVCTSQDHCKGEEVTKISEILEYL